MGDGTVPRPSATPREFERHQNEIYGAERHASLQNDDDVLFQLNGILTQPSFNPGDYRERDGEDRAVARRRATGPRLTEPSRCARVRTPIRAACSSRTCRTSTPARRRPPAARARRRGLVRGRARAAAGGHLPGHVARRERRAGHRPRHDRRRVARGELGSRHRRRPILVGGRPPARSRARRALGARVAPRPDRRQRARDEPPARARRATEHSPAVDPAFGADATKSNIVIAINNLIGAERREGRAALLLLRRPRADDARLEPGRERAARDRLHEHQHRPVDRAPLALGVLRDDAVRGPVPVRRRLPERAAVGRRRRV